MSCPSTLPSIQQFNNSAMSTSNEVSGTTGVLSVCTVHYIMVYSAYVPQRSVHLRIQHETKYTSRGFGRGGFGAMIIVIEIATITFPSKDIESGTFLQTHEQSFVL